MKRLRPFFSYFGSKWRLAPQYPPPLLGLPVIEPFAGSAAYSLYHHHHQIKLYDKYPIICEIWDYLINVSEDEILGLPILEFGEQIPNSIALEAQHLIGFWVSRASTRPGKKRRSIQWVHEKSDWTEQSRSMIARQLKFIRHWTIEQSEYFDINIEESTWFIDPPYQIMGSHYVHNDIDYQFLKNWSNSLFGQIIICENSESNWLQNPQTLNNTRGVNRTTKEIYEHKIVNV